jgi:hypothetical protein
VYRVPTSALLSRRDGTLCVVVRPRGARPIGVSVSAVASDTGTATSDVVGLSPATAVLVNPLDAHSDGPCRS